VNRVVVTGMGPVTPIGVGTLDFHEGQLKGHSGVGPIRRFDASDYPVRIAAEVDVPVDRWLDTKEQRRMDRYAQLAVIAAELAIEESGLIPDREDRTRIGTLVGSGIGGMETWEAQSRVAAERHPLRISPFFIPMMISNMAASRIAMRFGFMGPSSTVVTACTTGAEAIGSAYRMLQFGEADVMVAGGSEAIITPMGIGSFSVMRALSTRNDDPIRASRPFSKDRDGFVLGEGSAVVLLETLEHAKTRGAHIHGELIGFGRSADAYHMTEPRPDGRGAALAMQAALKEACLEPSEIGYLNAHGTSTPLGDRAEAEAIRAVFGRYAKMLPVSSTKSMTGHLLGAAGAVEAIAAIQAISSQVVPPTINHLNSDPDIGLDVVPNEAREVTVRYAISNSFAFGGQNCALIFGQYKN
jgi:3-oxoacyl-[acyl-carrier-protein] synthase II